MSQKKNPKYREIVINTDFGGFSLSVKAFKELLALGNAYALKMIKDTPNMLDNTHTFCYNSVHIHDMPRDDKDLVAVVRKLKNEADGEYASLRIVKVPFDVEWVIEEYDGSEIIAEKHRTWS